MGGEDPYSSSKGCAELVVGGVRATPSSRGPASTRVASARAGNVIGGGDWAEDRLMPDIMRAALAGMPLRGTQPGLGQALAARARPARRLPDPGAGAVGFGSEPRRVELRPGRARGALGRVGGAARARGVARDDRLGAIAAGLPAGGAHAPDRLRARPGAARLAPAPGPRRGDRDDRRVVPRAARRGGHARARRSGRSGRCSTPGRSDDGRRSLRQLLRAHLSRCARARLPRGDRRATTCGRSRAAR